MGIIVSLGLLGIYFLVNKNNLTISYAIWSILLVFYFSAALSIFVGFPTLSELMRIKQFGEPLFRPHLKLIPFSEGVDLSTGLNFLFFMPLGFALPTMWPTFKKLIPTLLYGLSFSLIIEMAQLFTPIRQSDVNDLIFNTLGLFLGWLLATYLLKWRPYSKNAEENVDWLIYPLIALFCSFFF